MATVAELNKVGQSVWIDEISRKMIQSGKLKKLIKDGVSGVTSNPSIFEKAIAETHDYDDIIAQRIREGATEVKLLYDSITIEDIQMAADAFYETYEISGRDDGYVSIEVSPYCARDLESTVAEARRLWKAVKRENVMIKIPGTKEGLPAIRQLLSEGINVNVTLLFSVKRYVEVIDAFVKGIEGFGKSGGDLTKIMSVASFFVSRIDTAADKQIEAKIKEEPDAERAGLLYEIMGTIAISNSRIAYSRYNEFLQSDRWRRLSARGARPQKLLWASTSTKNPQYSDIRYVEELVGDRTINTMPLKTLRAFRDHGAVHSSANENVSEAETNLKLLDDCGISLASITDKLLDEGIRKFSDSFDELLGSLERKKESVLTNQINKCILSLPPQTRQNFFNMCEDWRVSGKVRQLWRKDSHLWTGRGESKWMGWLKTADEELKSLKEINAFVQEVLKAKIKHVLVLGMGGSSLCPEVISETFKKRPGFPSLHVLDSTDPEQVTSAESKLDLSHTLFIVSSKSGSTLEPNIFYEYFSAKFKTHGKQKNGGSHFVAITDPGSPLEKLAKRDGFRRVFYGDPEIGGRYSALSAFGIIPAALAGVDIELLLRNASVMADSCSAFTPPAENLGVALGLFLGMMPKIGRNKITVFCSEQIQSFGLWLEQLLAESTGKKGRGLIPIVGESPGRKAAYNNDRVFIDIRVKGDHSEATEEVLSELEGAGHPVARITMSNVYGLAQEFFRWEMATAVAGSLLGINPFDQPDVEASKVVARELTEEFEKKGRFRPEKPVLEDQSLQVFADGQLRRGHVPKYLAGLLKMELEKLKPGDFFGILAYLPMNEKFRSQMQAMRLSVRDRKQVATCLEFGPRFLHSTGQVYKGGPNSGVFLEITGDAKGDLKIPGHKATFKTVELAQARGDFEVLTSERKRRAIRVHLKGDHKQGLKKLSAAIREALE